MTVAHNRESARTTDPAALADKVAHIRQILDHNRRRRLEQITTPINDGERFAIAEQQAEDERYRNS